MKPMLMPAPTEAARPTRKVSQLLWVAKAAAKSGASVETEPSMSPASPGWTYCSTKRRLRALLLGRLGVGREMRLVRARSALLLVAALDLGEAHEQLAHGDVRRLLGGELVEIRRLQLHELGLAAHAVEVEIRISTRGARRLRKPRTSSRRIGGRCSPKLFAEEPVERVAVAALLLGHVVEEAGRGGKVGPQPVREALVDARILLLVGDRQRDHLALGELRQRLHLVSCLEAF